MILCLEKGFPHFIFLYIIYKCQEDVGDNVLIGLENTFILKVVTFQPVECSVNERKLELSRTARDGRGTNTHHGNKDRIGGFLL